MFAFVTIGAAAQNGTNVNGSDELAVPSRAATGENRSNGTLRNVSVSVDSHPSIRVNVPLVLVSISAIDPQGRFVGGLRKEDFAIYEDGQPQRVSNFSKEDVPISVGLVFDNSGSMVDKIDSARMAVLELIRAGNPADEFCLIAFSERPSRISDFTQDTSAVMSGIDSLRADGRTSLLDAVYLGLDKMRLAKYSRRALLIVSDGGDNHSRYTERDIKRAVQESDVQIYAMDIHGPIKRNMSRPGLPTREELLGPQLLEEMTAMTGGRHFMIEDFKDLPSVAKKIGEELRNVYTLGYTPGDEKRDGKWHKIQVKPVPRPSSHSVRLYAKSGYYATEP